ncbi:MAG TPA: metallophosphoesterase [Micromonosporaceae bacterium]|nr:metallophosphoesterase [Micromonosporaceae bacterium]HCU52553.1 metallophosphoesterase [Micromonosporaceae bacterium]
MLIGLLSDAHGNPLGLRRALAALEAAGTTRNYFLGDAVGYLPGAGDVIQVLAETGTICQRGNHEAMLLGDLDLDPQRDAAYQLGLTRKRLTSDALALLESWPGFREIDVDRKRILMVHGSPRDRLQGYIYPDSDLDWMAELGYDAIFMGNTHRPFVAHRGDLLIVNVGSCGLPRDQGDLAACAVYDSVAHHCEILRVRVPAESVLDQFDDAIHPVVSECLRRTTEAPIGTLVPQREP